MCVHAQSRQIPPHALSTLGCGISDVELVVDRETHYVYFVLLQTILSICSSPEDGEGVVKSRLMSSQCSYHGAILWHQQRHPTAVLCSFRQLGPGSS